MSAAIKASDVGTSTRDEMEFAACPRCRSAEGMVVIEGRDYLHGIDGCFFGWQCAGCGLQYQNPRPTADRLAQLYPPNYAPHVPSPPVSAIESPASEIQQKPPSSVRKVWARLGGVWVRLRRSLHYRTGIGFFDPSPAEMASFLREQMGYSHLPEDSSAPRTSLSKATIRDCYRMAGIDLIPYYVPDGRLLEIGCATGNRLQSYQEQGWQHLDGIELTEQAATQAQQRGFSVICEQVERALDQFPDVHFDVIVSSMVLEHLHDPFTVVRTIARKLKPGGEFLFSTVTRDALDARWFGKYWSGYDFPRHMVYLRMIDIHEMVSKDFDKVNSFHQNAPIDFLRPAVWRRPENKLSDRFIAWLATTPAAPAIGEILARMGQTCRVSFRCRRKQVSGGSRE